MSQPPENNKFKKPGFLVWLLPPTYFIHLCEEYWAGEGLSQWFSQFFNTDFTQYEFIWINGIAMFVLLLIAFSYISGKGSITVLVTLGVLIATNGMIHGIASLVTRCYVPGTISGLMIWLPLGGMIILKLWPGLSSNQKKLAIAAGLFIQILVATIAISV
jgi:hypothetical protein